jgi:CheY-like chemotaxis protein
MPRQLLVIDDEEAIREVTAVTLELTEGWSVATAGSGTEGATDALRSKPDAILLDVMMPELDGPSTLRLLQSNPETAVIPVIFLTAKVQAADQRRFLQLGVSGVIAKPFDPMQLGKQVRTILQW